MVTRLSGGSAEHRIGISAWYSQIFWAYLGLVSSMLTRLFWWLGRHKDVVIFVRYFSFTKLPFLA